MPFHPWIFHFSYWCSIDKSPMALFWQKSFDYHMTIFMRCWICFVIIFAEDFHICFHLEYCFVIFTLFLSHQLSRSLSAWGGGLTAVGDWKAKAGRHRFKTMGNRKCTHESYSWSVTRLLFRTTGRALVQSSPHASVFPQAQACMVKLDAHWCDSCAQGTCTDSIMCAWSFHAWLVKSVHPHGAQG